MSTILQTIVEATKRDLEIRKKKRPPSRVQALAEAAPPPRDFAAAIGSATPGPKIIAECKQKSPSKGLLAPNYDPEALAHSYARGGATAISVLTEPNFFAGSFEHLQQVAESVPLPVLCKDFIIEPYQVFEARSHGAATYLLIAGLLDVAGLQYLLEVGRDLQMEALVECHNAAELEIALKTDCKIIGINNRDLKTFSVDLEHARKLIEKIRENPLKRVAVCESGIRTPADVAAMHSIGYQGFLIGEALIKSENPTDLLRQMLKATPDAP